MWINEKYQSYLKTFTIDAAMHYNYPENYFHKQDKCLLLYVLNAYSDFQHQLLVKGLHNFQGE